MRLFPLLVFIALGSIVPICFADSEPEKPSPPSIASYCERTPVNGSLTDSSSRRTDIHYFKPFNRLVSSAGHESIVPNVSASKPGSTAGMYSAKSVAWGLLNVSTEPGHKWQQHGPLALFPAESPEPRCWRAEYVGEACFIYSRLRPGIPDDSDPVYRMRHGFWFQTFGSLNRDIQLASRFLRLEADRTKVSAVNGIGEISAQYLSEKPLDPGAIEISTKYFEGGFNSVWGIRDNDAEKPGWLTLWLLAARTTNDGKKVVRVREISAKPDGQANTDLVFACQSPDVTTAEAAKLYTWRNVRSLSDKSASLWDMCSFDIDGRPVIMDRLCISVGEKTKHLRWDMQSKNWVAERLINAKWLTVDPSLVVTGANDLVVCRADGLLIVR